MASETTETMVSASSVTSENWRAPPFNRWAFHNVREILPIAEIAPAAHPLALPVASQNLGEFSLKQPDGAALDLDSFLTATATDAMVILHRGRIVYETYSGGTTAHTPHILMSSSKAMIGLLAGALQASGDLDIDTLVSDYVPEIAESGYRGATIRQLLDMRTGVTLNEDQARDYDLAVSSRDAADGAKPTFHGLASTLSAPRPHGGPFSYISINTDLAGWAIERATGKSFAALVSEQLWRPMGAEDGAYVVTDREGSPWCSGGLCATARDFARVGELLVNNGRHGADEVLPKAWIDDLGEGGDREAWKTGDWGQAFANISPNMTYRAAWYSVPDEPRHIFAMGVHGQNLFVDRAHHIVIAKLSSQAYRIDFAAILLTHRAVPELIRSVLEGASDR